jgi:predicted ribosome quality control (RQC) complex YloA/Tae2 family protein
MKRPFSGLDLHYLIRELQCIVDGKIEKIYQFDKREFIFRIYTPSGKKHLRINLDGMIHLTNKNYVGPKTPPGYVTFLRKYLTNTRIRKVYQKGLERLLVLEIETKTEKYELIFEIFNPGNVILVKEGIIIHPLEMQTFKTRAIKSKTNYEFPPSQTNVKDLTVKEIEELLSQSEETIGKFLATGLSLGGLFSDEIILRAKINKDSKAKENKALAKKIKEFLEEPINAFVANESAFPIQLETIKPEEKYKTFSEALDTFYIVKEQTKKDVKVVKNKFGSIILAQEKRVRQLEKEADEAQKQGEFIYERYQDFKKLLDTINELKKTKSLIEIEEILKQNKFVKNIDKKNKIINLEF